jgi:Tfp pilus assembly major pilin PilA
MTRTGIGAIARGRPPARDGTSLVEVMVAVAILAISIAAIYGAVSIGTGLVYASAQRTTAFALCKERIERMRATDYASIAPSNFPPETVKLTHLSGMGRQPLTGTRSSVIVEKTPVTRKEVTVTVTWEFRGRTLTETAHGTIYYKP